MRRVMVEVGVECRLDRTLNRECGVGRRLTGGSSLTRDPHGGSCHWRARLVA